MDPIRWETSGSGQPSSPTAFQLADRFLHRPTELPMERVGLVIGGRADVEGARPPPSRRAGEALNVRVGPETWAESQQRGSARLPYRYRISPMGPIRWKTFGSNQRSSPNTSQSANGFFHRPTRSEREDEMSHREGELLEDQECIWDIDSPCFSPRRLVPRNEPESCRYHRTSPESKDESRPTRRGAYNDHPLTKAILRHPGTSVHEGASLASTVSTLLADQDLPGGPSVNDLVTATERCATPSVAITDNVILDPDALYLRSGRYPPGSLSTDRAADPVTRCVRPRTSSIPGAAEDGLDLEMAPEMDEEPDPDMPGLKPESSWPLCLSEEDGEEHRIFCVLCRG